MWLNLGFGGLEGKKNSSCLSQEIMPILVSAQHSSLILGKIDICLFSHALKHGLG
jgi:hypothetical protein